MTTTKITRFPSFDLDQGYDWQIYMRSGNGVFVEIGLLEVGTVHAEQDMVTGQDTEDRDVLLKFAQIS